MKWFNNLSTKGKFFVAFGIPLCIMVLQIYYTQNLAFKLMQTRDDEFQEHFNEVNKLTQVQTGTNQISSDVFDLIENNDHADKRILKDRVASNKEKIASVINDGIQMNQKSGHTDDVAKFRALLTQFEEYNKLISQVLNDLSDPSKQTEAKRLFVQECNSSEDVLFKIIAETQAYFNESTTKSMDETKLEFRSSYGNTVILTIILLIQLYVN